MFTPKSSRRLLYAFLFSVALGLLIGAIQARADDSGCGTDEECMALIYTPRFCEMVPPGSYWWYLAGCTSRAMGFELESVALQPNGSAVAELVRDDSDGKSTRVTIHLPARHRR